MRRRSLLALLTAGALAAGVVTAAPAVAAPAAAAFVPKHVTFGTCADSSLQSAGLQCGTLVVPLSWSEPTGPTIRIAVSRLRHTSTQAKYQGVVLTNPGGPGGSGLGLAVIGEFVPKGVGKQYDWIGFDPRGVGASSPHLSCESDFFTGPRPLYEPVTTKVEDRNQARSKAYALDCAKAGGALLDHITTRDVAEDMDALRVALGQQQITYYGFSYGTYLGQVYSTLHPTRIRRMVLDSTVDPSGVWYRANFDQDVAFEKTENVFFAWVAKHEKTYHLGSTGAKVRARFFAEKAKLLAHPAHGVVGADEWVDIMLYAGYYQSVWLDLAHVFSAWANDRDYSTLHAAYESYVGPTDDNGYAVYSAVQCSEGYFPAHYSTYEADTEKVYRTAKFETWGNTWYNAPCLYWKSTRATPVHIDGKKVRSVFMIDETLDAATPYSGSLHVRSLYPNARLLAEPGGTSHASTLYGNACVDDRIADYLGSGTLPKRKAGVRADETCAPTPEPDPAAASNSARIDPARALAQKVLIAATRP